MFLNILLFTRAFQQIPAQKQHFMLFWSEIRENHHVQMPQMQPGQKVFGMAAPYQGRAEQAGLC